MNTQHWNTNPENGYPERKHRGSFLGVILVVIGLYWILKETGWMINLPGFDAIREGVYSASNFMHEHLGNLLVPVLILAVGLLLVSGRRRIGGLVFLVLLVVFLPGLIIPGIFLLFAFPILLILVGVLVIRSIF